MTDRKPLEGSSSRSSPALCLRTCLSTRMNEESKLRIEVDSAKLIAEKETTFANEF